MVKLVSNPNLIQQLPTPTKEQMDASQSLCLEIIDRIHHNDNWLSFKDFMSLALYHPLYGYYSGGNTKIGTNGDFITAPELGPLFSYSLVQQITPIIKIHQNFDILEFGAGTGQLAYDLLLQFDNQGITIANYYILEVSAELKNRQQNTLAKLPKHILTKITWLTTLPEDNSFQGIIIANEIIDAMPVNLFMLDNNQIKELGLTVIDDHLVWQHKLADVYLHNYIEQNIKPLLTDLDSYISEINLLARDWLKSVSQCLAQGSMFIIDYGFARHEYYHPDRDNGTLMCHYRHFAHQDPLFYPGLQDITAHVDFTSLAEVAVENDLDVGSYINQAHFLLANNVTQYIDEIKNDENIFKLKQQLKMLTSPTEMGELFKVLVLYKNIDYKFFMNLQLFDKRCTL